MKSILDDPRSGKNIAKTAEVVNNMIDNILENKDSIYDMLSLRNFDYYTYTHSVNVSVLSIGLGIELGLKRNEIEKLGTGAMLHDIGKSTIPHEVLNKQGKLNDVEYRIIMNHVIDGYNLVKDRKDLDKDSIIPLLQHHEKLNGKGYPNKLIAKEIKLFGRITSIADCYDALTTQRPYKPAFTPYYALSIIAKETGNYDPELLRIFIKMLGNIK
ncbi:MAG TPA: HD-GYP domain-containing protein [Nitrospirae bacterium]|nr:HD-GYP domain-containing protein [Nitrospirota bacterium]